MASGRIPLGFKSGDSSRGWQTVERHIYQECITAGGSGPRCGLEPLPVCTSRIVDVNVSVHQAGKNCGIAEIVQGDILMNLIGRHD
jgi:hypothetical protein